VAHGFSAWSLGSIALGHSEARHHGGRAGWTKAAHMVDRKERPRDREKERERDIPTRLHLLNFPSLPSSTVRYESINGSVHSAMGPSMDQSIQLWVHQWVNPFSHESINGSVDSAMGPSMDQSIQP
jgi:hypothetical protein